MELGGTPNFSNTPPAVPLDASPPVELHNPLPLNTLRQILVWRANDYALNSRVLSSKKSRRRERIIRFVLLHGPYHNAQCPVLRTNVLC